MLNHGINAFKRETQFTAVSTSENGIPFFVGTAPVFTGEGYTGRVKLIKTFDEFVAAFGYSDDWDKWTLCEAAYSHFKVFGMSPAIFFNVFNPATHKTQVSAESKTVTNHIVEIENALDDSGLVIQVSSNTLVKGVDYDVVYDGLKLVIELISTSTYYAETSLSIAYNKADTSEVEASDIEAGFSKIDECMPILGVIPDILVAPKWSATPSVAAVMAAKCSSDLWKGKAIVDISTTAVSTYSGLAAYKTANGYDDENMIVCWPLIKKGYNIFNFSTVLAGHIALTDFANGGIPYESPSNKEVEIDGCVLSDGSEVYLTLAQADTVTYTAGCVTAVNWGGWRIWGNYTGVGSGENDVAKSFIATSRMMDFISNKFVTTYIDYVDRPLNRVLIDAIVDDFDSYLNGLAHDGALVSGTIAYVNANNSGADLLDGKFRLDCTFASPVPAQRVDLYTEFSVNVLADSLTEGGY